MNENCLKQLEFSVTVKVSFLLGHCGFFLFWSCTLYLIHSSLKNGDVRTHRVSKTLQNHSIPDCSRKGYEISVWFIHQIYSSIWNLWMSNFVKKYSSMKGANMKKVIVFKPFWLLFEVTLIITKKVFENYKSFWKNFHFCSFHENTFLNTESTT